MAVYTILSDDDISSLLSAYDLPALATAEGIRSGIENTNYKLTLADGTRLILTLFEKRVNEAELPFFASLMDELSSGGIPCPRPMHARDGQALRRVRDKPAMMVTFLEGTSVTSIRSQHTEELGRQLARLHLAGMACGPSRRNDLSLAGWQQLCGKVAPRADEIAAGLGAMLQEEAAYQQEHFPSHLPQGIIHADLFPDNVFFDAKDRLTGIIDFYFACNDMLAYDVAICLNAWCFDKEGEFALACARALLRGYNEVRPLSGAELEALPVLARGAALRFLLTRTHDGLFPVAGALVTPKDPLEYIRKLRFHRSVKHHGEYGL